MKVGVRRPEPLPALPTTTGPTTPLRRPNAVEGRTQRQPLQAGPAAPTPPQPTLPKPAVAAVRQPGRLVLPATHSTSPAPLHRPSVPSGQPQSGRQSVSKPPSPSPTPASPPPSPINRPVTAAPSPSPIGRPSGPAVPTDNRPLSRRQTYSPPTPTRLSLPPSVPQPPKESAGLVASQPVPVRRSPNAEPAAGTPPPMSQSRRTGLLTIDQLLKGH